MRTSTPRRASTWPATSTGTNTSLPPATSCSPCRRPKALARRRHRRSLRHLDRHHHSSASLQVSSDLPALAEPRNANLKDKSTDDIDLAELDELNKAYAAIREQMSRQIVGQNDVVDQLLIAVFARGHCILEGVPGLAKTLMVHSLAESLALDFNRIQFTPDLMPSDITGTEVLYEDRASGARELRFVQGPIFANLILADEINRTPPKTQAALLEAMQERQVTAGGHRHVLPDPFFVLATQNPIEQEGTYPLPEAQLDRFLFKIFITYPTPEEERRIYRLTTGAVEHKIEPTLDGERIAALAAPGAARARFGPLHRLRDGPGAGDPRPRPRRPQVHRRLGGLGGRARGPASR